MKKIEIKPNRIDKKVLTYIRRVCKDKKQQMITIKYIGEKCNLLYKQARRFKDKLKDF